MIDEKIITQEDFSKMREGFRKAGNKVVLCHGVYDLLHYGHIEHLREAKRQGDILIVSVTAERFVNKGPGRPYFSDKQRMAFLASLEFVDYVLLSKAVTVHETVSYVQPDIYVKGQEYKEAKNDITGNIGGEQAIVEQYGGRIYFTQGEVFSSTKLLNNYFDVLPPGVVHISHQLKEKYGSNLIDLLCKDVEKFRDLRVLVVGDVIIDEYVFCKLQGLTSKDSVLSTRFEYAERYAGGSLAIARHIANFSDHVVLCSMIGQEDTTFAYIQEALPKVALEVVQSDTFVTPVKRRYLKLHPQRREYDKLFSVNMLLDDEQAKKVDYQEFCDKLTELTPLFDMVVVCDYGHGLFTKTAIQILEKKAKFLAVNCQTNSSNFGMNLITKYNRADMFVVDERELRLAFREQLLKRENLLDQMVRYFQSSYGGWVTIGAEGAIGQSGKRQIENPAVTLHVKDTVGAGDAFYSLAALCAVKGYPIDIATLISNTAGAIKTNLVGNSKAVDKVTLLKFLNTILNV